MQNAYIVILFSIIIVATVGFVFDNANSGAAVYMGDLGEYRYEDVVRPYPYIVTDTPQGYAQEAYYPYQQPNNPYYVSYSYVPQGYAPQEYRTVSAYSIYPRGYQPTVPRYTVSYGRTSVSIPSYGSERSFYPRGVTVKDYAYPRAYGSPEPEDPVWATQDYPGTY